jgi:uncharacterized membrane protein YkgB
MTTRVFLAGVLGAVVMFIWMFIAHMVLPLGEAGIAELPNEAAVLGCLQSNIERPGMYLFPGLGLKPDATRQEKHDAMQHMVEKAEKNPSGLLIDFPAGSRPFTFGRWLGIEFVTELIEALLVVFLLAQSRLATTGGRVGFVLIVGVIAAISTNVPYWNWYGFPTVYTLSYMTTQIIGFLLLGIVAALVLPKTASGAIG